MALDERANFAKGTLSAGIDADDTSLVLQTGEGALFPTPTIGYNCVIWDIETYANPADDPNKEIVRVTNKTTDTFTIDRAEESTSAASHSLGAGFMLTITAKTITDIETALAGKQAVMGDDDNYVTDDEKAALHSHSNKSALDNVTNTNTGDETQSTIKTKLGAATSSVDGYATSTQITKLDGIEAGADVTDATNVSAAGAVMEGDTTTASMSFVVDEDNMASNSSTKLPTQQSVKAYVDSGTVTMTNKRITQRVQSVSDAATITPDADANDCVDITAIAQAFTIANPSGTPTNFQKLIIRIKDNGTARAITWGNGYVAGGVALPSTTVLSKILNLGFQYNTANSLNKWQLIASSQEA